MCCVSQFVPQGAPATLAAAARTERGETAWVTRSAALAHLGDACPPVAFVSAPAGAGKTTLAAQWLGRDGRRHAVVTVAAHQDDPALLAGLLQRAMGELGLAAGGLDAVLTGAEPSFSAALLPGLRALAGTPAAPYVLVVDDVHRLRDARCQLLLQAVADSVPAGSTLALLSRGEPPAWLARARAERRLLELGPKDLAFDQAEATALFRGLGLRPTQRDVAHVVEQAEGWAVGLYLTALAMQRDGSADADWAAVAPHGGDRFILDYLTSQVLAAASPDEHVFMVATSVLEELHGPLCDAVLGRADSAAVLAALHRRIQLVVPLDGEARRLRYHHLLQQALQAQLAATKPALVPDLHRRAAAWYAAHDDLDAAVRHAKAADDLPLTSRLIWSGIGPCVTSGRPDRLRGWLADLTDRQLAADPWLSVAAALCALQSGNPDGMTRWIIATRRHAGPHWRGHVSTDAYAATYAVLVALVGADGLAETAVLCADAIQGLPPDAVLLPVVAFLRGVCLTLQRDLEPGRLSLREAETLARALDVPLLQADALSWQGLLAVLAGDPARGAELISRAGVLIRAHHLDRLATSAHCVTAQALMLALRHDTGSAIATLRIARTLTAQVVGIAPWFAVCGRLVQAHTAILLGDGALARTLIAEARDLMTEDLNRSLAADLLQAATQALRDLALDTGPDTALTAAELRVLQFLPSHLRNAEIGEHLYVSVSTVKTHIAAIYRKLQVCTRAEAVARAQSLGLIEAPPPPHL